LKTQKEVRLRFLNKVKMNKKNFSPIAIDERLVRKQNERMFFKICRLISIFQLVSQPIQPFVQTVAGGCTRSLNVPIAIT